MIAIETFIRLEVTKSAPQAAQSLFKRKYNSATPDYPNHVVAYYKTQNESERVACYIHFAESGDMLLGGGACVDERVLRSMSAQERVALRDGGGVYRYALSWAVAHFARRYAAVFGYCGNALAERIDRAAGFQSTPYDRLLVYWTSDVDEARRRDMVERAQALTPF